ncbi:Lactose permease [Lachnellula hyalina]|uniref:Lactose permease n=1 Tax=Lachnellula hyalina TaxID=1316788 RepID=A0A8H8QVW9_9HELO|nr:Lactose permease [Lachnellula hyalina]TVY23076.1 Lactose permease [Lachnellula hyalina]
MPFYTATKKTFELGGREFPRVTWYKDPGMRSLYVALMFAVLTSATNGYDGSMMNGLQALDEWKKCAKAFHNPDAATRGLLNAIMSVGSIVALPVTPYIADGLGRRVGVITGCVIMVIGVVLQSIGVNIQMFIAARFLIGFGIAIAHGSAPLLIAELVHPQHRAIFTTIYNSTWYFGSIVAAWLTYGTFTIKNAWSWRIPSIVQALPSVIQLIAIWLVPESPRYLVAKGKTDRALHTLAKCHANGNIEDELVQIEFREIHDTIKLEQEFESNGWFDLFKTVGNRRRLLILFTLGFFSQWSGNGLVSYYMSDVLGKAGVSNKKTQLEINGILNIINFLTAVTMCFFIDKLGRRPLFLFATGGMFATFCVWTICAAQFTLHGNPAAGYAEIVFIFIFYVFYNSAWSGLLVGYAVEILPYRLRAKGLTLMFLAIDLALFFNSYVNPVALDALNWKYYIVYDVWLFVELLTVYFFYIETRNTPLEEIVKFFDGEAAILGGDLATEKSKHYLVEKLGNDAKILPSVSHRDVESSSHEGVTKEG